MAKKKGGKSKGVGDYVMKSRIKEAFKKMGCNSSSDVIDGFNTMIGWYVSQAADRAKANRRKTVRAHDIIVG